MTSDDVRSHRGRNVALVVTIAVGAWVTPALVGFDPAGMAAYWLAAFAACLVPSWAARGRDGVDLGAAARLWATALAGAAAVFVVLMVWLFAFADWGFDLCDDDWQGDAGEDCF